MRTERRIPHALMALVVFGLVLPASIAAQEARAEAMQEVEQDARTIEVEILGMSCPFCAYGVEQKLKRLDGVEDLEVELKTGITTLSLADGADISNETLKETVEEAGFKVAEIRRSFESEHPDLEDGDDG